MLGTHGGYRGSLTQCQGHRGETEVYKHMEVQLITTLRIQEADGDTAKHNVRDTQVRFHELDTIIYTQ